MMRTAAAWPIMCLVMVAASGAAAQEPPAPPAKDQQAKRMIAAFDAWTAQWGVQNASFAAMRGDDVIGQARRGDHRPSTPEPVASLSKAITSVCVVKLVEAGRLTYAAKLGALIPGYFRRNKPADQRAKQISVSELLTQTSGLGYDPTQGTPGFAALNFSAKNMEEQLALALTGRLIPKVHYYNNINALALGLVIEAVTGQPYEEHCRKTVLTPAGADGAALNPPWKIMSSWGGWKISALEYAHFLEHFRPGSKLLKSKPAAWPKTALDGGAFYSIGVYLRQSGSSYNFWHSGSWRWTSDKINENYGAYFAMWRQDLRFAATYAPQPPFGAVGDLDYRLYVAAYPDAARAPVAAAPEPLAAGDALGRSDRGAEDRAIGRSYGEAP